MRARQLGIAAFLVLALVGATGCGDGEADDPGTGTEAGDVDAGGDDADTGGDEGDSDGGDGEDGDDGDDGGGSTLTSYADAAAIADALGCADSFEPVEAPPVGPGSPPTESIGFCTGPGGEPMMAVFAEDDMGELRAGTDAIACQMLPGFTWIVGANWLVTPYGEPDPAVNEEIASTLGGELLSCA